MPRQARIDYPGALQHVYARGIERRDILKSDQEKEEFYGRIKKVLSKSSVQIYAWCIMNNHFHLLVQTGTTPLAEFMRQILTAYAVYYNLKNKRSGHVFQNRYKSIVCDKDEYLLPLIRYIHLNPVKAKIVEISQLNKYRWSGHKELVLGQEKGLINREEVLGYFGRNDKTARVEYIKYARERVGLKEDYLGGGLARSLGGFESSLKENNLEEQKYDERILGNGNFVNDVFQMVGNEEREKEVFKDFDDLLDRISKYYRVDREAILNRRDQEVREARKVFIYLTNHYLGKTSSWIGKILGIKQSAASIARKLGREIVAGKGLVKKLININ